MLNRETGVPVAARIQQLSAEGRPVNWEGAVSNKRLLELYEEADIFTYPSRYEGFGFPVLEAMACGAPVITTNRTALPEVVGRAAELVAEDDSDALGEVVFSLIDSPGKKHKLQTEGFDRIKKFSWERTAEQTLNVYREVIA